MEEKDTPLTDNSGEQLKDNFYHGVISKIFWSNETGVIHSDSGKEVPFIFEFVTLLGAPRQDINFLRPGMRVGFDVGWTSKGLRASTIKIYDLYQEDLDLEQDNNLADLSEASPTAADHPISRYRPQEMRETEAPRYHQRRPRPRPLVQEQKDTDSRSQSQEHRRQESSQQQQELARAEGRPQGQGQYRPQNRLDRRPREGEQGRPETRFQGQGQNRQDVRQGQEPRRQEPRPQGQEQRRPDLRQQGQRRNESPHPLGRANAGPSSPAGGPAETTWPQSEERSRRSRRRRGRR